MDGTWFPGCNLLRHKEIDFVYSDVVIQIHTMNEHL